MAASALDCSGPCGENGDDNVTYTFDSSTGELTISGTGAMKSALPELGGLFSGRYQDFPWISEYIKRVTIENGVTNIGDVIFEGCINLANITISDSVTSIGYAAFRGCSGLTSITIPDSVTSIVYYAFDGCSGLTSITVASGNTKYDSRGDCNAIIETSTNTLIRGCNNTEIPATVTSIGDIAFSGCTGLTNITIPDSVTSISNYAFWDCINLTSITIPDSVTSIGEYAFACCSGLTSITIPDSVTSIGDDAFWDCINLTIIGSGDETKTPYLYAKENGINYASKASIKIDVTTNVPRDFVIYILDSSNQPTRQFVVTNGTSIEFVVATSSTFTVQVYETLYMTAKIDGDKLLKKTYSNVMSNKTIAIDISGVMNVNNWVMI